MRMPSVSPIDRTRMTESTRESFVRSVNGSFVSRARVEAGERSRALAAGGSRQVQDDPANDVGLRLFAGSFAQIDRLFEGVGSLFLLAHAEEHVSQENPPRRVALVERACFAKRDGRSPKLALSPQPLGSCCELFGSIAE